MAKRITILCDKCANVILNQEFCHNYYYDGVLYQFHGKCYDTMTAGEFVEATGITVYYERA